MKTLLLTTALAVGFATIVMGQTSVTATCKDGTSFSGTSRSGACSGHGGVQSWGSATTTPTASTATAAKPATTAPATGAAAAPTTAALGGGPDKVWVNTASKVYHCPGSEWYGKTKKGEYMTEAAAKAGGNHPDHGKACSS